MSQFRKLAQDIGAAPLGDLIASIGKGVAEAQAALDAGSLEQSLALYDQSDDVQRILRETGYRPTFYTIPETDGELKLSLSVTGRQGEAAPPSPRPAPAAGAAISTGAMRRAVPLARVYAAPVDGRYQNAYSFSSQVSATVRFKIVAVPPTSEAEAMRVVPDFAGLALADAVSLAESFDLEVEAEGGTEPVAAAKVSGQAPEAGAITAQGALVTLAFS